MVVVGVLGAHYEPRDYSDEVGVDESGHCSSPEAMRFACARRPLIFSRPLSPFLCARIDFVLDFLPEREPCEAQNARVAPDPITCSFRSSIVRFLLP